MADTRRSKIAHPNAQQRTRVHPMQLRSSTINKRKQDGQTNKNLIRKDETRQTNPFLPIEIIRKILLLLPADFLYNVIRLVCRKWREIINEADFVREHLSMSAVGALIEMCMVYDRKSISHFVEVSINGQEKWPERKRKRGGVKPRQGESITIKEELGDDTILHSCDGLLLTDHINSQGICGYSVVNPVRRERMMVTLEGDHSISSLHYILAMVCGRAGREYKLVATCRSFPRTSPDTFTVSIMTIGSDDNSWREVEGGRKIVIPTCSEIHCGKYVYWVYYSRDLMFGRVLDAETETMHEVKNGPGRWYVDCFNHYIESEKFLIVGSTRDSLTWEFWGLTDPKSEEWTKLYKFNLSSKMDMVGVPEKWRLFATPELVVLQSDTVYFTFGGRFPFYVGYNVRSGHIFKIARHQGAHLVSSHVPSLVPVLKQRASLGS